MSTNLKAERRIGNTSSVVVCILGLCFMGSHLREFNSTGFAEGKKTK